MIYLFNLETLLNSEQRMSQETKDIFLSWSNDKEFCIVTRQSFGKAFECLPLEVLENAKYIFCFSGNAIYKSYKEEINSYLRIRYDTVEWKDEVIDMCNDFVKKSKYEKKKEEHIKKEPGILAVSSLGLNSTPEERQEYFEWDASKKERTAFVKKFNKKFKDLEASLGDQVSVEIREKGKNKSQIFDFLEEKEIVLFQCENEIDLSLSNKIEKEESGKNHSIKDSKETFEIISREYYDIKACA